MQKWNLDTESLTKHLRAHDRFVTFMGQVREQATGLQPAYSMPNRPRIPEQTDHVSTANRPAFQTNPTSVPGQSDRGVI